MSIYLRNVILEEDQSGVLIYYTNKDLTFKTTQNMEYQLKAGWNFFDKQNEILTQDINELFAQGYRWRWETWL